MTLDPIAGSTVADRPVEPPRVDVPPPAPAPQEPSTQVASTGTQSEGPLAVGPPPPPVVPEPRRAEIDSFVQANANASERSWVFFSDHTGGERIGQAMQGNSALGQLTPEERRYMADQAVAAWMPERNTEAVDELAEAVEGNHHARRDVAAALATPAADIERHFAQGGAIMEAPGGSEFRHHMVERALDLDPPAVVDAYKDVESDLGRIVAQSDRDDRMAMYNAVSDGRVDPDAANRLMTGALLHSDEHAVRHNGRNLVDDRQAFARALATVSNPDQGPYHDATRDQLAQRIDGILAGPHSRDFLLKQEIRPEMRTWAFNQIVSDPSLTAEALADGWESDAISQRFAQTSIDAFARRGTEPETLGGEALRNTIGQSLGLRPDILPGANETPEEAQARLGAGMSRRYYGDNAQIDAVVTSINELNGGGDPPLPARVSVVPVAVTSNEFGAATLPVFRVNTVDGRSAVVDHQGGRYDSVEEWADENELPPGTMTYPMGLDLRTGRTTTANTPGVVDSPLEYGRQIGNGVATAAGIAAGAMVIAGTGGTATPLVLGGAAALWTVGTEASDLAQLHDRGRDITDMSDPEVRGHIISMAAAGLSLGAMGGAAAAARSGTQISATTARAVVGLQYTADTADVLAAGDQAAQLAHNWNDLSPEDRAAGVLNIAFWGGMAAVSTGAGGARVQDATSFQRLENQLRFGSPYEVSREVPGLGPGQVRVNYQDPSNIRIETGAGAIDPTRLQLHVGVARQIDAAAGLEGRLARVLGDRSPQPGSAAFEVRTEIGKIRDEARGLAERAADPSLTQAELDNIALRQRELAQDIELQSRRLDRAGETGGGFVAAPRSQADTLAHYEARGDITRGLPAEAPVAVAPSDTAAANVDYGTLPASRQAPGIDATITRALLDTGSSADPGIQPPGWLGGANNHARGHLLANRLGGSGTDERNLVTLHHRNANSPVMRDLEALVYRAVDAGEVVNYRVTPIYNGAGMPTHVAISARGSNGFSLDVTITNRNTLAAPTSGGGTP